MAVAWLLFLRPSSQDLRNVDAGQEVVPGSTLWSVASCLQFLHQALLFIRVGWISKKKIQLIEENDVTLLILRNPFTIKQKILKPEDLKCPPIIMFTGLFTSDILFKTICFYKTYREHLAWR
jgi:hypothetical protein